MSLSLVRASFNVKSDEPTEATTILHDVREGLRYVSSRTTVLRNISVMMALINVCQRNDAMPNSVSFADQRLDAHGAKVGGLFAAARAAVWSSPVCLQAACANGSASPLSR